MDRLLWAALGHIRRGNLQMTSARGSVFSFGDGSGPAIAARFTSAAAQYAALLDPELRLGEAYMNGTFVIEKGSIADFIDLVTREHADAPPWTAPLAAMRNGWRRLNQLNWRGLARANVAHHYDLDGRLYSLFLDSDRQYSCGYFETPGESLDDAQLAKKRHLAAKLLVRSNDRILDIGCGWGGLALYLAEFCGADGDRDHPVAGAARGGARPCRRTRASKARRFPAHRLPRHRRPLPAHRLRRHVRACRRQLLRRVLRQMCRIAGRGWRHGAAFDRAVERSQRHQSLDSQVYLPGRLYAGAVGGRCPRSSGPGCLSPTSRFCACTTPRPSQPGATASSPIARMSSASMMRASCGCGSSTSPARRPRSAARI